MQNYGDNFINNPVFVPDTHIEIEEDQVYVSLYDDYVVLTGDLGGELVALIEKGLSIEEIVEAMPRHRPEQVYFTLMRLVEDGYVMEAKLDTNPRLAAFWSRLGYRIDEVTNTLSQNTIGLIQAGFEGDLDMQTLFEEMGVQVVERSEKNIVFVSSYYDQQLQQLVEEASLTGGHFLLCKPVGASIWVGPVIGAGDVSCWYCLAHYLKMNHPSHSFKGGRNGSLKTDQASPPGPILKSVGGIVALEAIKWLTASSYDLNDTLISIDLRSLETQKHVCRKRANCEACGHTIQKTPDPIALKNTHVHKLYNFRNIPARQTVLQYEHLISPITGIVRSLERVGLEGDYLTHNYTASHSGRLKMHSIESLRLATRDQSGGKGKTDIQSKASGLSEALERFSAVYNADHPDVYTAFSKIECDAIHPNHMLLFSDKQHETRDTWNHQLSGKFQYVPEPFDESENIAWTKVWSLTHEQFRYVPSSYCYYGFDGAGSKYCKADSNGLASGNNIEEAIIYGLLELVERDAVSIWWYNRLQYPEVDLDSFNDPYFRSVKHFLRGLDRELWVLDLTNDLDIPTFVAVSPKSGSQTQDILLGFGAHFDAHTAITRSILEVFQSLPAVSKSVSERRSQLLPDFADVLNWWETATVDNQSYLLPCNNLQIKTSQDYASYETVNLEKLILSYVESLSKLGLEMLVLNMTRPDIGMPVARVIVPGLRHFWRRLAAGRLYDVPLRLGWLTQPVAEEELNPISMFL